MNKDIEFITAIPGAATYATCFICGKWEILMYAPDEPNAGICIDFAKTYESANRKVMRWQKKENKIVLKNNKKLNKLT